MMTKYLDFFYEKHWLITLSMYAMCLVVFACFFMGVPAIFVWMCILYILVSCGIQIWNIIRSLREGEYVRALLILVFHSLGVDLSAVFIFGNLEYTVRYLLESNIFLPYPNR